MSQPGAVASADVAVIGGGIVGAAAAYELASAGLSVVLVERDDLASGASGRNPGFVWMHTRRSGPQMVLSKRTRARFDGLTEELDHDFDLRREGGLIFFRTPAQQTLMREFVAARQADGIDVALLDGDEARDLCPMLPDDALGATYCREDAQITTRKLVEGLARGAERRGARVLRGVEATTIALAGDRVSALETTAGRIDCGAIVLAAGVWSPLLAARLGIELPIVPMRLQVVATDVQPPMLRHLVYGPQAITQYDLFHALPSYRPEDFVEEPGGAGDLPFLELACQTGEGRFLLGCPIDMPAGLQDQPDLEGVAQICRRLPASLPSLRSMRFERAWAGLLPHTADSLPVIDEAPGVEGLVIAAGHVFGNSSALATAELVAARVTRATPPFELDGVAFGRDGLSGDGSRW